MFVSCTGDTDVVDDFGQENADEAISSKAEELGKTSYGCKYYV